MGFLNIPEKQKIFQIDEQQINYTSHVNHLIDPPKLVVGYITHCFLVKSLKTWSSVTCRWSHSKNGWEFQAKKHYQESRNFAATHSTFSKKWAIVAKLLLNNDFFWGELIGHPLSPQFLKPGTFRPFESWCLDLYPVMRGFEGSKIAPYLRLEMASLQRAVHLWQSLYFLWFYRL